MEIFWKLLQIKNTSDLGDGVHNGDGDAVEDDDENGDEDNTDLIPGSSTNVIYENSPFYIYFKSFFDSLMETPVRKRKSDGLN